MSTFTPDRNVPPPDPYSGAIITSPAMDHPGSYGASAPPVLRLDAQGHLWVGDADCFDRQWETDPPNPGYRLYVGPRLVLEVVHARSRGGLTLVITDEDYYLMSAEEWEAATRDTL